MAATRRHWRTAGWILAFLLAGAGCNSATLPFLWERICGNDGMVPPELMQLADKDKDKLVKVLLLTHQQGVEVRPELLTADQDLASLLTHDLMELFKANKEKVSIMPSSEVKRYKDDHPNWYMDLAAVGKRLKADYVVYVELSDVKLFGDKTIPPMLSGQADVSVTAIDLQHTDQEPVSKQFREQYPEGGDLVDAADVNPHQFYRQFMGDIAQHIARFFAAHPYDAKLSLPPQD